MDRKFNLESLIGEGYFGSTSGFNPVESQKSLFRNLKRLYTSKDSIVGQSENFIHKHSLFKLDNTTGEIIPDSIHLIHSEHPENGKKVTYRHIRDGKYKKIISDPSLVSEPISVEDSDLYKLNSILQFEKINNLGKEDVDIEDTGIDKKADLGDIELTDFNRI